jgi:hypothetical protein
MEARLLHFTTIIDRMKKSNRTKQVSKISKTNSKNHVAAISKVVCILWMSILLLSCGHQEEEYHSILDKIEAKSKHYKEISISSKRFLAEYHTIEITEGEHTFLIPERKSQIQSFECSECHSKPLKKLKGKEFKKAHWDIRLKHANAEAMNCTICHDAKDMNHLKSLTGSKIDFNQSYNVCKQCHTKQFEDWKGGAHGKRIESWALPRASMTCVNCHNPHSPSFESRWPAQFNTQKRKERQ